MQRYTPLLFVFANYLPIGSRRVPRLGNVTGIGSIQITTLNKRLGLDS